MVSLKEIDALRPIKGKAFAAVEDLGITILIVDAILTITTTIAIGKACTEKKSVSLNPFFSSVLTLAITGVSTFMNSDITNATTISIVQIVNSPDIGMC